jgi:hypothetical protein
MKGFNNWVDQDFGHDAILTSQKRLRKKKKGFAALF